MRRVLWCFVLLVLLPWDASAQPFTLNASHPLWRGLVAWYPVIPEITNGKTWWDIGPNRLPATMTTSGGAWAWRGDPSGRFGGTVSLDGTSYGTIPHAAPLSFEKTTPFSLSIWFATTATSGNLMVKGQNANPWTGYWLEMAAAGAVTFWVSDDVVAVLQMTSTSTGWNDGRLHLATATYSGANVPSALVVYLDGKAQATTDASNVGSLPNSMVNSLPLRMGTNALGDTTFVGRLTNAMVYNRALAASEVQALYQMQAPDYGGLLLDALPLALVQAAPPIKRKVKIQ